MTKIMGMKNILVVSRVKEELSLEETDLKRSHGGSSGDRKFLYFDCVLVIILVVMLHYHFARCYH